MGLSSNARLLSLTARLTSNEYESQQLSNAKMRLATRSQEVSENYISALNSTNYNFLTFDSAGNSYNSTLTPALLYQYADNKNQYILTNSAGKALISNQDAINFEKSSCLQDFLACYGLNAEYKTENLETYYEKIKDEIDIDGGCKTWNNALAGIKEQIDAQNLTYKYGEASWAKIKNETYETAEGDIIYGGPQGLYQNSLNLYNTLITSSNAGYDIDVADLDAAREQVSATRQNAVDVVTYDSWLEAQIRNGIEARNAEDNVLDSKLTTVSENLDVLKEFLPKYAEADDLNSFITDIYGSDKTNNTEGADESHQIGGIYETDETDSTDETGETDETDKTDGTDNTSTTKEIKLSMLNTATQNFFNTIMKMMRIIDKANNHESYDENSPEWNITSIDNEHTRPQYVFLFDEAQLSCYYQLSYTDPSFYMQSLQDKENAPNYGDMEDFTKNLKAFIGNFASYYEEMIKDHNAKDSSINKLLDCLGTTENKDGATISTVEDAYKKLEEYRTNLAEYNAELERLGISSEEAFTYADTTQAQWYTNLWYKLNGASTTKTCTNQSSYSVLDSGVFTSTSWITNAITQGQINIESASALNCEKKAMDDENPFIFNLTGIKWTNKIFSNCTDIVQSDDDKAVATAEAEYKREMAEINAKDEKYQRQISLLDSQHTALQTEYDSVKGALDKNIDRSFKAFQG